MTKPPTPSDPHFDMRVRASFARQPMMASLGVVIESLGPGEISLTLDHDDAFTQQHGFLHAGAVCAVLDSACGYAAFSLMPAEAAVLTVNNTLNLLAPADAPSYRARAWVTKRGRTISVAEGRLFGASDGERPIATMTATLMALVDRGIRH